MVGRASHGSGSGPIDSQDAKDFIGEALDISEEAYDTPVIVRLTTRLSHSQGLV